MRNAYMTLLSHGDAYVPGIEALGRSLRSTGTVVPLVLMVTPDISKDTRARLSAEGWNVHEVAPLENPHPEKAILFPRFAGVFTKLRAWEQTDFDKVVLLDADTVVLQNIDELFARPQICAAPDFFMPDRFNSGVMVLDPSRATLDAMVAALGTAASYDGGDQGFLNEFFGDWWAMPVEHRLRAGYNLHHFVFQFLCHHDSLKANLDKEVKIIHYTLQKPWKVRSTLTGASQIWWNAYYGAHPEESSALRRRLHKIEDWTFDHVIDAIAG